METDRTPLEAFLADEDLAGLLIDADGETADQRYFSGFDAPDPFHTLVTPEETHLLVPELEYGRAVRETDATVRKRSEFDHREHRDDHGDHGGMVATVAAFLADAGAGAVGVPPRFPVGMADGLRARGVDLVADTDGAASAVRARKSSGEVERIEATQRVTATAMARAESMLAAATIDGRSLVLDGETLTSERVKREIERTLLEHGCALEDTIVAAGEDGADPHDRGNGPIPADEPVVVDIFPRDTATHYHGDMTRTFVRGTPDQAVRERYAVTREAYETALEEIRPGVTGDTVHRAVCAVYEEAGFSTLRSDPGAETGFIHGTGHGVGLEVHEAPRLALGGDELAVGHVVTVEPGLYDPAVGGVRLEDLVVVTPDGPSVIGGHPMALEPTRRP